MTDDESALMNSLQLIISTRLFHFSHSINCPLLVFKLSKDDESKRM